MDETGVTTVQKLGKIFARRGQKQAWNTCHCGLCSESLHTLCPQGEPPPSLHQGCCRGTANKSGGMQNEDFLEFLCHFQTHTCASCWSSAIITPTCLCEEWTFVGNLALFSSPTPRTVSTSCSHWTAVCLTLSRRWVTPSLTAGWDIILEQPCPFTTYLQL